MKIMLEECDYPLAKMMLRTIRESAAVDDAMVQQNRKKALGGPKGEDSATNPLMSSSDRTKSSEVPLNPDSEVGTMD
eukprot:SAG31_NODE_4536_length_3157_cov_5.125899_2_plen_77_part_00